MTTLSVVALCKNEETDMPGFLHTVLPWVDEVIIVDDGSTDQTEEIIRSFDGNIQLIKHVKGEGGFSAQRNVGADHATADWIIYMDIDMRPTPEFAHEVQAAIKDQHKDAYTFRIINYFLHRPMNGGGWQHWAKPWLVRRGNHRFGEIVHEQIKIDAPSDRFGEIKSKMIHLNDENFLERLNKNFVYAQFEAKRMTARGVKIAWYHFLIHPTRRALRSYFWQGGYREGVRGIIFAFHTFAGIFNWYAIAWDMQNRIDRGALEAEIMQQWQFHPDAYDLDPALALSQYKGASKTV